MPFALTMYADAVAFQEAAAGLFAADPVHCTILTATVAQQLAEGGAAPGEWFAVVRDDTGEVVSAAMRRAQFPPYLLAMPDDVAADLADRVLATGERPTGANGNLASATAFAQAVASSTGFGEVRVTMTNRLFRLGTLTPPSHVRGRAVDAVPDDIPLIASWTDDFAEEAHVDGAPHTAALEIAERVVTGGTAWLWRDEAGAPVSMAAGRPPAFGVARIGPVYTPPAHRRNGFGAAITAHAAADLRDRGAQVCLFTDLANPTSNAIYQQIGFDPVGDEARLVIDPP